MMTHKLAAVSLFALALAACSGGSSGGGGSYGAGDPNLAASNMGSGPIDPFLADGTAVLKALDAIAAKSGTPLRVTDLTADRNNGLTVNVQEPANHVNVDQYVVAPDGTLTGPTPVKMMSMDGGPITAAKVDRQAFDPKSIPFAKLADTAREAIAKSNMTDARVSQWEIAGIGPDDRRFIYLDASRGRPAAEIDAQLKIVHMSF